MRQRSKTNLRLLVALLAAPLAITLVGTTGASAFSQRGGPGWGTPVGHEWLTVAGAKATIGSWLNPDTNEVTGKSADCGLGCDQYGTKSFKVWSAVMGQRWVDIMGFLVLPGVQEKRWWDAVAQNVDRVQYDHFLRKSTEVGDKGAAVAIKASIARFRKYFIDAANMGEDIIAFTDGGVTRSNYRAIRAYFFFGRAVHLFQDSFSPEHAYRDKNNDYKTVLDIMSYLCTKDSPQHGHTPPLLVNYKTNGDIIWDQPIINDDNGNQQLNYGNLKPEAKAAHEAMKDLWLAFGEARLNPGTAGSKADGIIAKWMTYKPGSPAAQNMTECEKSSPKSQEELENDRDAVLSVISAFESNDPNHTDSFVPPFRWPTLPPLAVHAAIPKPTTKRPPVGPISTDVLTKVTPASAESVKPPKKPRTKVKAPWVGPNGKKSTLAGKVMSRHGKLVKIKFDVDGGIGYALASEVELPQPPEVGPVNGQGNPFVVGEAIEAVYISNANADRSKFWPGMVSEVYGQLIKVEYDDGAINWVAANDEKKSRSVMEKYSSHRTCLNAPGAATGSVKLGKLCYKSHVNKNAKLKSE